MASVAGSTNSFAQSSSIANSPFSTLGGGLLNSIFNVPQRLVDGGFKLGGLTEFVPPTNEEIRQQLKASGAKKVSKMTTVVGEPGPFQDMRDAAERDFLRKQGQLFGSESGGGGFGGFGSNILGLTNQGLGVEGQALFDIISQQGQPIDVSAIADANFTQLKEQFSGFGSLFGTDLQAAQGRNVLQLDVQAQMDARQRQMQALGLAQSFNPFGFDVADTQGGRELALFNNFFNPQSSNPFSGGVDSRATSSTRSEGSVLGELGNMVQLNVGLSGTAGEGGDQGASI